jgi:hypothetical protein
MRAHLIFALFPGLLWLAATSTAQDSRLPKRSFSLSIQGPLDPVRVGSAIPLKLTLTNPSDGDVREAIIPGTDGKPLRSIDIRVYMASGAPVRETVYGMEIHGRKPPGPQGGVPHGGGVLTVFTFAVKPGKTFSEDADLSKEFDLNKPGKYTVQADRFDPLGASLIKSDIITVTVVE